MDLYNILLKDDKTYPYIHVHTKEDFPRVSVTRKLKKDGKYFEGVNKQTCIIRVPKGSVELYRQAKEWKEFENIVEIW